MKACKYLILCAFAFVILFSVTSCTNNKPVEEYNGYYLYGIDAKNTQVVSSQYTPESEEVDKLIEEYIEKMKEIPESAKVKQVIPEDVSLEDYVIDTDGNLTLYFNSAYSNTSGIPEILMRAAITKNLVQIPEINAVQFYVSGQPLTDNDSNPIGLLTADDFIDNTGGETNYTQKVSVTLYFSDSSGNALTRVPVEINYDATMSVEESILHQLISGPESINGISEKSVLPTIPEDTKINKITVKDKICYLDLSEDFLDKPRDISSYVAIYSVVDTLTELSNIDKVQFSIDGQQTLLYNESINFGNVFKRNLDIVSG
ncbi:MAG: GerMN domain-containing protein [Lachnospiraceae bacterium]|nr:GerMN domain-containing protein [Lachnospiraceae bacterium]